MGEGKRAVSGLLWSLLEMIGTKGVQFAVGIVLARLLLPEDFGMLGLFTIFIAVSQTIVDSGFSQALIREGSISKEDCSTVFHFNMVVAILLYAVIFTTADLIGVFFGDPGLSALVRVSSLVLVLNASVIIQQAILIRSMDFRTLARISFTTALLAGSVAIAMAVAGFGVWSLVANLLLSGLFQFIFLFHHNPWLPLPVFHVDAFKRFFRFGSKLMVSGLLDTASGKLYYVMIGRVFTPAALGYYTHADRNLDAFATNITAAVQRVTFPLLTKMVGDDDRLKKNYKQIIRLAMFLFLPAMIGLAALAEPLYLTLFGEKWQQAVFYFRLICIAGMLYPIHAINLNLLKVKGRSDLYLRLEIIKKALFVLNVSISIRWGISGLLVGAIVDTFLCFFINSYYSGRLIAYRFSEQMADVIPFLALSGILGAALLTIQTGLTVSPPLQLALLIPLGCILYGLGAIVFCKFETKMLIAILRDLIAQRKIVQPHDVHLNP